MNQLNAETKRRFPVKMSIVTIVTVLALFVMQWKLDFFNEQFNLNPGIPHVLTILLPPVLVFAWVIWAFFFARLRWLAAVILLVPVGLLTFYYPDLGGDANIIGWKTRFWSVPVEYVETTTTSVGGIDLATVTEKDFPQFLGRDRSSQVNGIELVADWKTQAPELRWKQSVGEGWSGFVAVNGYAVTQEQRGADECVTCYEISTGKLVWIYKSARRHEDITAMGKVGPRATPTIDEGRVYVTGGTGVLDCLDGSTGELIWSVDVPQLTGIKQVPYTNGLGLAYTMEDSNLMWGRASSPLIYQDRVIVPVGGPNADPQSAVTLMAFDKVTGSEIWRGGNRMVAYGSPSIETVLGQPQILLVAEDHAVGHDPETGIELWSHARSGKSDGDANCSQVTFINESQLLLSKGYNMGGELIELTKDADRFVVKSLRKDARVIKTKLTSPVIHQGHSYSLSDGYLECVEIETFKRKWKQRGRFGNGQLLLVGNHLLVHSEDGQLMLIDANPQEFKELGSVSTISGTCWNTLCLYGNLILLRSEKEMACFELTVKTADSGNVEN